MKRGRFLVFIVIIVASLATGCTTSMQSVPIVSPKMIEMKQARSDFIPKYCRHMRYVIGSDYFGAQQMCEAIDSGKLKLEGVHKRRASQGDRTEITFVFSHIGQDPISFAPYRVIFFEIFDNSSLSRVCWPSGYCRVHVDNRSRICFGDVRKEDLIIKDGNLVNIKPYHSFESVFLFQYNNDSRLQGEELISIFLSTFPELGYK